MVEEAERSLTMCWFGVRQPLATSVVHVPEQEISPNELEKGPLIFIWDKFMKSPEVTEIIGEPVPWSPAIINGYYRTWNEKDSGLFEPILIQKENETCLGAVLLTSRLKEQQLNPLVEHYKARGYTLKKITARVGDLKREILAFLPN